MPELSSNLLIVILGIVFLASTILYLREYNLRKKLQLQGDKFLEQLKEKGWETLHKSIKKSQDILGKAELEGVKVVAESKIETAKLEEEYASRLAELTNQSKTAIETGQKELIEFMVSLQKRGADFEQASQQATKQRISEMFARLEQRLSDFLISTEQRTTSSIELELKSTRELIESYKNQQLKLIDENVIAMMEQTMQIVLAKKLSLKDQLELVYEALEKAKVEKFVA